MRMEILSSLLENIPQVWEGESLCSANIGARYLNQDDSYPLPFKCSIMPRSRESEALVRVTALAAEADTSVGWS